MDRSNIRSENEKIWRARVAQAAEYPGALREFCQNEGVSVSAFQYWKNKLGCAQEQDRPLMPQPFARVQVESPTVETRVTKCMPDPRWLAEFIHHLQRGDR